MLVHKPKQRSKQQTGFNYSTNFQAPDLKFSLTSQFQKRIIYVSCLRTQKLS